MPAFSANASKSKQATSRKKTLEKIELDDIKPSSRRYPFVNFQMGREIGNDVLSVQDVSKTQDGKVMLKDAHFHNRTKKIKSFFLVIRLRKQPFLKFLRKSLNLIPDRIKWGVTTSRAYFPLDNSEYFQGSEQSLVEWLRQYSPDDQTETFLRGFLGRMLFSGEEVNKKPSVLSGGEKVRCMLSKMMLTSANVLLLDEPMNHLDLESIQALNNGLIVIQRRNDLHIT